MAHTINIDIDNTVNNFIEIFCTYYNAIRGNKCKKINVEDITYYDLTKLGVSRDVLETLFFKNNSFFEKLEPLTGSVYTINELINRGFDVRFVTAIDYEVIQARLDFIHKYFPKVNTSKSLIVTNNKNSIYADFVIDDLEANLRNVDDKCVYFVKSQKWNSDVEPVENKIYRFDDWRDLQIILAEHGLI